MPDKSDKLGEGIEKIKEAISNQFPVLCSQCRYWVANQERERGSCLRFPPIPVPSIKGIQVVYPETFHFFSCGEGE
jgi:hypothetical protein